jgi:hypothetical protein
LIAYAAALGATAADGNGVNSPFTTALLRNLTRPGLDVRLALGQTHDDVLAATDNKQEPYIYTSLGGETLALVPVPSPTTPVAPAPASPTTKIEQSAFEAAMRADSIPMLEAFLIQYPQSSSADIARRERDRLKSANALLTPATNISPAAPVAPPMTKPVPSKPITTNIVPIVPKPRPVHIATRPRVVQLAPRAKYDTFDSSRPTRSKCVNIAGASFCE